MRYIGFVASRKADREEANIACNAQKVILKNYCNALGIKLTEILEEVEPHSLDKILEGKDDASALAKLLDMVINRKIEAILVDTKLRLARNKIDLDLISTLCREKDVRIIEVPPISDGASGRVYIYHCTNSPSYRYSVVTEDIDDLYLYSIEFKGELSGLFLDMRLTAREKLESAIATIAEDDMLIVKNYNHIKRKTDACLSALKRVSDKGGKVTSMEEGCITSTDSGAVQELRSSVRRVAYYDAQREYDNQELELQKVKAYIRCYADGWEINSDDVFIDKFGFKSQEQLELLIKRQDKYDLILVSGYSRLSGDISKFVKIANRIHVPIHSMKEEL